MKVLSATSKTGGKLSIRLPHIAGVCGSHAPKPVESRHAPLRELCAELFPIWIHVIDHSRPISAGKGLGFTRIS